MDASVVFVLVFVLILALVAKIKSNERSATGDSVVHAKTMPSRFASFAQTVADFEGRYGPAQHIEETDSNGGEPVTTLSLVYRPEHVRVRFRRSEHQSTWQLLDFAEDTLGAGVKRITPIARSEFESRLRRRVR